MTFYLHFKSYRATFPSWGTRRITTSGNRRKSIATLERLVPRNDPRLRLLASRRSSRMRALGITLLNTWMAITKIPTKAAKYDEKAYRAAPAAHDATHRSRACKRASPIHRRRHRRKITRRRNRSHHHLLRRQARSHSRPAFPTTTRDAWIGWAKKYATQKLKAHGPAIGIYTSLSTDFRQARRRPCDELSNVMQQPRVQYRGLRRCRTRIIWKPLTHMSIRDIRGQSQPPSTANATCVDTNSPAVGMG